MCLRDRIVYVPRVTACAGVFGLFVPFLLFMPLPALFVPNACVRVGAGVCRWRGGYGRNFGEEGQVQSGLENATVSPPGCTRRGCPGTSCASRFAASYSRWTLSSSCPTLSHPVPSFTPTLTSLFPSCPSCLHSPACVLRAQRVLELGKGGASADRLGGFDTWKASGCCGCRPNAKPCL